jgi:hypothetical protein
MVVSPKLSTPRDALLEIVPVLALLMLPPRMPTATWTALTVPLLMTRPVPPFSWMPELPGLEAPVAVIRPWFTTVSPELLPVTATPVPLLLTAPVLVIVSGEA